MTRALDLKLFDTATGEVRKLAQRDPGKVSLYSCGPTVYDVPHIGHGRQSLTYDILRRFVESQGVEFVLVQNVTDIDDKIINRANERGVTTDEITTRYEAESYAAMDRLNILRPTQDPHATAYVDHMIKLIAELIAKGYAYETSDTVYFSPHKLDGYGLLAQQSLESLQAGARVEQDAEKQTPVDFALWKKAKPGEPSWDSPWGAGRPGWHTECVVMSLDILGDGFDLHSGGQDLKFPHHENERAQAVAAGYTFAKHWMHHGFVEMNGEKMSKSLGNFTTLPDMLDQIDPRAYRMLILQAHYRSPIEVTPDTIAAAEAALDRLDDFARRFAAASGETPQAFVDHMNNDLDTPKALGEVFTAVREANSAADSGDVAKADALAGGVFAMANAFGLELNSTADEQDDATADLIKKRDAARAGKDWAAADDLRDQLQGLGWVVEDTSEGTKVHK